MTGKRRRSFPFLGIDPTLGIGDKVLNHVEEAEEEERRRLEKSDYYALCPACGRKQIKRNLLENGCFICGWKGTEDEIEFAKVKKIPGISVGLDEKGEGYRMECPNCGATVITEEFEEKG